MKKIKLSLILGAALFASGCAVMGPNIQKACSLLGQQQATARHADNTRQMADTLERNMETAKASLSGNGAYQGGQCVQVKQRPIPPKPETLSEDIIVFQGMGSAVDLATRRFNSQEVVEALAAVRMDDYLKVYAVWKQGQPQPCALISPSQTSNWLCTVFSIAGREAKYSCIQDVVKGYAAQAVQSCRAPLLQWEADVAAIKSEPERLQSECQRDLAAIADAEKRLPQLRMEEAINREESQKLAITLNAALRGAQLAPGACRVNPL